MKEQKNVQTNNKKSAAQNQNKQNNRKKLSNNSKTEDLSGSELQSESSNDLSGSEIIQKKANKSNNNTTQKGNNVKSKLPEKVQAKMENSFNADFSGVNIVTDSSKASSLNALAFTHGNTIHFAPGKFQPQNQKGQELIGHELTHVVQQNQGKVTKGSPIGKFQVNTSNILEREADEKGIKAAAGLIVNTRAVETKNNNNTPHVQLKLDNYKVYEEATHLGFFHKRPDEIKAIDNLVEEYIRVRTGNKRQYEMGINYESLDPLLSSITRYIENFTKAQGSNKDRVAKFNTFKAQLTDERTLLDKAYADANNALTNHIRRVGTPTTMDTLWGPAIVSVKANTEAEVIKAISDTEATKARNHIEPDEDVAEGKTDLSAEDITSSVEAIFSAPEALLGGDNRSGLADVGKFQGVRDIKKVTKEAFDEDSDAKKASDSLAFIKGMALLGFNLYKMFGDGDKTWSDIAELASGVVSSTIDATNASATIAGRIAGLKGSEAVKDNTDKVAAVTESASSIFSGIAETIKNIKSVYDLLKGNKTEEEQEAADLTSMKQNSTPKFVLQKLESVAKVIKAGFVAAKAIQEFGGGPAGAAITNALPGLDIAISAINIISKSIDLIQAWINYYRMRVLREESKKKLIEEEKKKGGGQTDKQIEDKINAQIAKEKDLRAKRSNLEALYNDDEKKLQSASASPKDKKEIIARRQNLLKAIGIIDEELKQQEKTHQNDQNFAMYKTSKDFADSNFDTLMESAISLGTEITRLIGSILTLCGPAAPAGAILKGIASGVDFAIAGGKAVVAFARDKSARDKAIKMVNDVNARGGNITMAREDSFFSINENKSTAAKAGEKKNNYATVINLLTSFTKESDEMTKLAANRPRPGTVDANTAKQYEVKIAQKRMEVYNIAMSRKTLIGGAGIDLDKFLSFPASKQPKLLLKFMLQN